MATSTAACITGANYASPSLPRSRRSSLDLARDALPGRPSSAALVPAPIQSRHLSALNSDAKPTASLSASPDSSTPASAGLVRVTAEVSSHGPAQNASTPRTGTPTASRTLHPKHANSPSSPSQTRITVRLHSVKPGETLNGISRQYGIPPQVIMALNKKSSECVYASEVLYLPVLQGSAFSEASDGTAVIQLSPSARVTVRKVASDAFSGDASGAPSTPAAAAFWKAVSQVTSPHPSAVHQIPSKASTVNATTAGASETAEKKGTFPHSASSREAGKAGPGECAAGHTGLDVSSPGNPRSGVFASVQSLTRPSLWSAYGLDASSSLGLSPLALGAGLVICGTAALLRPLLSNQPSQPTPGTPKDSTPPVHVLAALSGFLKQCVPSAAWLVTTNQRSSDRPAVEWGVDHVSEDGAGHAPAARRAVLRYLAEMERVGVPLQLGSDDVSRLGIPTGAALLRESGKAQGPRRARNFVVQLRKRDAKTGSPAAEEPAVKWLCTAEMKLPDHEPGGRGEQLNAVCDAIEGLPLDPQSGTKEHPAGVTECPAGQLSASELVRQRAAAGLPYDLEAEALLTMPGVLDGDAAPFDSWSVAMAKAANRVVLARE